MSSGRGIAYQWVCGDLMMGGRRMIRQPAQTALALRVSVGQEPRGLFHLDAFTEAKLASNHIKPGHIFVQKEAI